MRLQRILLLIGSVIIIAITAAYLWHIQPQPHKGRTIILMISDSLGEASWANLMLVTVSEEVMQSAVVLGNMYNDLYTGPFSTSSWQHFIAGGDSLSIAIGAGLIFTTSLSRAYYDQMSEGVLQCLQDASCKQNTRSVTLESPLSNIHIAVRNKLVAVSGTRIWNENTGYVLILGFAQADHFTGKYYPLYIDSKSENIVRLSRIISGILDSYGDKWQALCLSHMIAEGSKYSHWGLHDVQSNYISYTFAQHYEASFICDYLSNQKLGCVPMSHDLISLLNSMKRTPCITYKDQ